MENFDSRKGQRRRRLPPTSRVLSTRPPAFDSSAPGFAVATTRTINAVVTSDEHVSRSGAPRVLQGWCRGTVLILTLTTLLHPLFHDYTPPRTSVAALTHDYSSPEAAATHFFESIGATGAEASPPVADRREAETAAVALLRGPLQSAARSAHGATGGSTLPMLVRRPVISGHPDTLRFPLSVDVDITDESFEVVERTCLEIARAVRRQQQQDQRRDRKEYLNDIHNLPAARKKNPSTGAMTQETYEGRVVTDITKAATKSLQPEKGPASQYKYAESFANGDPPAHGQEDESTFAEEFDEDDSTGTLGLEEEAPVEEKPGSGGTGGRLIVGLTEITFPEMKREIQRSTYSTEREQKIPHQSNFAASPLREQAYQRHANHGGKDALGTSSRFPGDEEDGGRTEEITGEPETVFLSHREAVREANQRLRLDQLQDLGIIRSVKVLENVGLVVLEFQDHLSEEEIKETIKTLWQRNRSTWLIEPDSEIVFRGRDSFERGEFVPVVPTAEEAAAGDQPTDEPTIDPVQEIKTSLPGQGLEVKRIEAGQRVQPELVSQRYTGAQNTVQPEQTFLITNSDKRALGTTPPRSVVDGYGDTPQSSADKANKEEQARGQAAPHVREKGLARSSLINAGGAHTTEAVAHTEKKQVQEFRRSERMHIIDREAEVPQPATGRRLTHDRARQPVPSLKSSSKRSMEQFNIESGGGVNELPSQTQDEDILPDRVRYISHTPGMSRDAPAAALRRALAAAATANGTFTGAYSHSARGRAEDAVVSTTRTPSHPSLLKPHMGIVPLSVYDAAQEAVRDALEGNTVFRDFETSPRAGALEECSKALAACRRRAGFCIQTIANDGLYVSNTDNSSSARNNPPAGNNGNYKQTCTEEGPSRQVTPAFRTQTGTGLQSVNRTKDTNEEETAFQPGPLSPAPIEAIESLIGAVEQPGSVGVQPDAEGTLLSEKRTSVAPKQNTDKNKLEDSAQRRVIFASVVAPANEKHLPNDQYFSRQWAYHDPHVNVRAVEAWNVVYKHRLQRKKKGLTGRAKAAKYKVSNSPSAEAKVEPIIVAVIDTGIDYTHEDLRTQMWVNEGEIPGNGIDDDGNGYVDDYRGYDFERDKSDPMDYNGHGTHVAGIIAAAANNRRGITGVNWEAKLMPLKFVARSAAAAEAIDYSLRMGAKISTNSWGYASPSEGLKTAIKKTAAKGQLFVSAVDNAGKDNTYTPDYPPNWGVDTRTNRGARNILRVANLTAEGGVAGTSNFGPNNVDVVAPGTDIISTVPARKFPEGYGYKTGTSMATPLVAGIAAMVWAANPAMKAEDVRDVIVRTSTRMPHLKSFVIAGNVNAHAAVLDALELPKEPVADTTVENPSGRPPRPFEPAVLSVTPVTPAADSVDYAQPITAVPLNQNIFPSEEAFVQHVSQALPLYKPTAAAEQIDDSSKPSATAEPENEATTATKTTVPATVPAFVSSLVSILGPLRKIIPN